MGNPVQQSPQRRLDLTMSDVKANAADRPSPRLRRVAITIACMAIGAVAGLVVFALTSVRRPPPPLTQADFEAATKRWLELRTQQLLDDRRAERPAERHNVCNGKRRPSDSRRPKRRPHARARLGSYWTVDGLFEIIREDLQGLDQPEAHLASKTLHSLFNRRSSTRRLATRGDIDALC